MSQLETEKLEYDLVEGILNGGNPDLIMDYLSRVTLLKASDLHYLLEKICNSLVECISDVDGKQTLIANILEVLWAVVGQHGIESKYALSLMRPLLSLGLSDQCCVRIRKQVFIIINQLLHSKNVALEISSKSSTLASKIEKLATKLFMTGDYEAQALILETMFRITSVGNREHWAKVWFSDSEMQSTFLKFNTSQFELECRKLLNIINRSDIGRRVYSFVAQSIMFGEVEVQKPRGSELWVDFNYDSKSISFYCADLTQEERENIGETDRQGMWETILLGVENVARCSLNVGSAKGSQELIIKLTCPCTSLISGTISESTFIRGKAVSLLFWEFLEIHHHVQIIYGNIYQGQQVASSQPHYDAAEKKEWEQYSELELDAEMGSALHSHSFTYSSKKASSVILPIAVGKSSKGNNCSYSDGEIYMTKPSRTKVSVVIDAVSVSSVCSAEVPLKCTKMELNESSRTSPFVASSHENYSISSSVHVVGETQNFCNNSKMKFLNVNKSSKASSSLCSIKLESGNVKEKKTCNYIPLERSDTEIYIQGNAADTVFHNEMNVPSSLSGSLFHDDCSEMGETKEKNLKCAIIAKSEMLEKHEEHLNHTELLQCSEPEKNKSQSSKCLSIEEVETHKEENQKSVLEEKSPSCTIILKENEASDRKKKDPLVQTGVVEETQNLEQKLSEQLEEYQSEHTGETPVVDKINVGEKPIAQEFKKMDVSKCDEVPSKNKSLKRHKLYSNKIPTKSELLTNSYPSSGLEDDQLDCSGFIYYNKTYEDVTDKQKPKMIEESEAPIVNKSKNAIAKSQRLHQASKAKFESTAKQKAYDDPNIAEKRLSVGNAHTELEGIHLGIQKGDLNGRTLVGVTEVNKEANRKSSAWHPGEADSGFGTSASGEKSSILYHSYYPFPKRFFPSISLHQKYGYGLNKKHSKSNNQMKTKKQQAIKKVSDYIVSTNKIHEDMQKDNWLTLKNHAKEKTTKSWERDHEASLNVTRKKQKLAGKKSRKAAVTSMIKTRLLMECKTEDSMAETADVESTESDSPKFCVNKSCKPVKFSKRKKGSKFYKRPYTDTETTSSEISWLSGKAHNLFETPKKTYSAWRREKETKTRKKHLKEKKYQVITTSDGGEEKSTSGYEKKANSATQESYGKTNNALKRRNTTANKNLTPSTTVSKPEYADWSDVEKFTLSVEESKTSSHSILRNASTFPENMSNSNHVLRSANQSIINEDMSKTDDDHANYLSEELPTTDMYSPPLSCHSHLEMSPKRMEKKQKIDHMVSPKFLKKKNETGAISLLKITHEGKKNKFNVKDNQNVIYAEGSRDSWKKIENSDAKHIIAQANETTPNTKNKLGQNHKKIKNVENRDRESNSHGHVDTSKLFVKRNFDLNNRTRVDQAKPNTKLNDFEDSFPEISRQICSEDNENFNIAASIDEDHSIEDSFNLIGKVSSHAPTFVAKENKVASSSSHTPKSDIEIMSEYPSTSSQDSKNKNIASSGRSEAKTARNHQQSQFLSENKNFSETSVASFQQVIQKLLEKYNKGTNNLSEESTVTNLSDKSKVKTACYLTKNENITPLKKSIDGITEVIKMGTEPIMSQPNICVCNKICVPNLKQNVSIPAKLQDKVKKMSKKYITTIQKCTTNFCDQLTLYKNFVSDAIKDIEVISKIKPSTSEDLLEYLKKCRMHGINVASKLKRLEEAVSVFREAEVNLEMRLKAVQKKAAIKYIEEIEKAKQEALQELEKEFLKDLKSYLNGFQSNL